MGAPGKASLNLGKTCDLGKGGSSFSQGLSTLTGTCSRPELDTNRAGQPLVRRGPPGYPPPYWGQAEGLELGWVPEEFEQRHGDSPCPPSTPESFY